MRALVLFKGTGSIDRALEQKGFQVDSLDIDPKCKATWTCDILAWEAWKDMAPGRYDFVWASPPCTEFSIARTTAKRPRDLEYADSIVQRTLDIIFELAPKAYLFENPQTGLLKTRKVVEGLPWRDVTYCMYSDGERWTYKKQTRLWGNLHSFVPRPVCTRKCPCPWSLSGKHPTNAQRFNPKSSIGKRHTLAELYSMPEQLCDEIAEAAARVAREK